MNSGVISLIAMLFIPRLLWSVPGLFMSLLYIVSQLVSSCLLRKFEGLFGSDCPQQEPLYLTVVSLSEELLQISSAAEDCPEISDVQLSGDPVDCEA